MKYFTLLAAMMAAVPMAGALAAQSASQTPASHASQTPNGTIIWSAPPDASGPKPPGAGDRYTDDGPIIWNDAPQSPRAASPRATSKPPATGLGDKNGIIWNDAPRSAGNSTGTASASLPNTTGPCREFQQDIVIDGQRLPAHGTMCQQADGTWRVVDR